MRLMEWIQTSSSLPTGERHERRANKRRFGMILSGNMCLIEGRKLNKPTSKSRKCARYVCQWVEWQFNAPTERSGVKNNSILSDIRYYLIFDVGWGGNLKSANNIRVGLICWYLYGWRTARIWPITPKGPIATSHFRFQKFQTSFLLL